MTTDSYSSLVARQKEIKLLAGVSSLLGWDQETGMPPKAADVRSQQLALLAGMIHDKAVAPENQFVAGELGWVYAVSGRRADALRIAQQFRDLSSHAYVDSYQFAQVYAGLGEKDEAFRLLERGYKERSAGMVYLAQDVAWYGMHSDPRYADLLRRMGLPKPE